MKRLVLLWARLRAPLSIIGVFTLAFALLRTLAGTALAQQTVPLAYKQLNSFVQDSAALAADPLTGKYLYLLAGSDGTNYHVIHTDSTGNIASAGNQTPADAAANPTTAAFSETFTMLFNGTTWDRARDDASKNLLVSLGTGLNGTDDSVSIRYANIAPGLLTADADAQTNTFNGPQTHSYLHGFNGSTWDRLWSATKSAAQSTNYLSAQEAKDLGRTYVTFTDVAVAGTASETLLTFTQNKQGATTGSVTSYVVTSGKTFRLQTISVCNKTTTNADTETVTFRHNTAGACTASSGAVVAVVAEPPGAAGTGSCTVFSPPDEIEVRGDGTQAICASQLEPTNTTNTATVTLAGFEY